ncbi:MAG: hydroxymethylpyrimidine/phosphomethylpyrimidine kinase [Thiotrichaceae bacterium]|nr:hydroxymethylpyrimidine/phosphomethylpyrimidine kinase [Thiotrichaceae bacterium]
MMTKPNILTISGHDPSGGAGIQADIESIQAMGCHPTSLISCLTAQNSCNVESVYAVDAELLYQQYTLLVRDMPPAAIKIGLISNHEILAVITTICAENTNIPIVVDPVLAAGGGKNIANQSLTEAIFNDLLPKTTVVTPNTEESTKLSGLADPALASQLFIDQGCTYSLVTGTHANTDMVTNHLYDRNGLVQSLLWDRLPYEYHGSGCTLASALAARLGLGEDIQTACEKVQQFVWDSLNTATTQGQCQYFPHRIT